MAQQQHLSRNLNHLRLTAIVVATAVVISVPSAASAGPFDKLRDRVQTAKRNVVTVITNVAENRPVATALGNATENLRDTEALLQMVKELKVFEQVQHAFALMRHQMRDYQRFAGGGSGCEGVCRAFRAELGDVFERFRNITDRVPMPGNSSFLADGLDRAMNGLGHVPPRVLYLLWQALDGRLDEFHGHADAINEILDGLPPFAESRERNQSTYGTRSQSTNNTATDASCRLWKHYGEDEPELNLALTQLDTLAWTIGVIKDAIPEVKASAAVGAEGGVGVAMGTGAAEAGVKPSDTLKIALGLFKAIPEGIGKAIELRAAHAKVHC